MSNLKEVREIVKDFPIVLVTGGSGYIGSHTVLEVLKAGCACVVIDNLCNSHMEALLRVYYIARAEYIRQEYDPKTLPPLFFHTVDLRNQRAVSRVFQFWQSETELTPAMNSKIEVVDIAKLAIKENYKMLEYPLDSAKQPARLSSEKSRLPCGKILSVIHFAALKAVGESVSKPLEYYQNNIGGLLNLLDAMSQYDVKRLVFSSSAVVYGTGKEANISEDEVQVGGKGTGGGLVTNPYGRSKWMAEEMLNDFCIAHPDFEVISLRYFNPTGSHPSGLIGEDPKGTPNNIVPVILQAYQRRRSKVYVFGSNYDTNDGTGVRDYIHVADLARGHLAALRSLIPQPTESAPPRRMSLIVNHSEEISEEQETAVQKPNYRVYNLGTGHGYSVLDILKAFATVCGREIPFAISDARPGDLGTVTASTDKATTELGWQAEFGIQDMCQDVYTWATENPLGYERLRRLSTLALKDPGAMRRASMAVGMMSSKSGLSNIVEEFASLASNETDFNMMIRKMSTLGEDMKEELDEVGLPGHGTPTPPANPSAPSLGLFGNVQWDPKKPLPMR